MEKGKKKAKETKCSLAKIKVIIYFLLSIISSFKKTMKTKL
jgi:hypothetical protein